MRKSTLSGGTMRLSHGAFESWRNTSWPAQLPGAVTKPPLCGRYWQVWSVGEQYQYWKIGAPSWVPHWA